ncbi:hypothetical protein PoHVEF18_006137 [Penicillium ochrochloron]
MSEPVSPDQYRDFDAVACEVARILARENVHFLLVGGYATTLVAGNRMTSADGKSIKLDTFDKDTFKMPDLDIFYSKTDLAKPTIIPRCSSGPASYHDLHGQASALGAHLYSERPQSQRKRKADEKDMTTLLKWAINCGFKIDLDGYIGKPKDEFYEPLAKLYSNAPDLRPLLDQALKPEDLAIIRRS